jgi:hypothetical protein
MWILSLARVHGISEVLCCYLSYGHRLTGAAIAEIELIHCPFCVQIHGLPRHNMVIKNAIIIGKALGDILAVENIDDVWYVGNIFGFR